MLKNRQWLLRERPDGALRDEHLQYHVADMAETLRPGEILLRTLLLHFAPTIRNWMNDRSEAEKRNTLYPYMVLGQPVLGPTISQIAASENPNYPPGTVLFNVSGWQDYAIINPDAGHPVAVIPPEVDLAQSLSVLGPNGLAAYFGLEKIGKPVAGETVVVSGAAGSTGSVAAQIAKLKGCHVIGIAGGPEKCRWLTETLGLDAAIDYKSESVQERLAVLAPDGVDVFFDNVGGDTLSAVVETIAVHGRIALCGQIATYNEGGRTAAPLNVMRLVYWRARIEGFIMSDWWAEIPAARAQLMQWIAEGKLQHREDIRDGFENIPAVFNELFAGTNAGTLLLRLGTKE
jgi:NADPH-dependent curcumin reductase CurA